MSACDSSHSSVERISFPDSCTLLDYMFGLRTRLMDGLVATMRVRLNAASLAQNCSRHKIWQRKARLGCLDHVFAVGPAVVWH